MLFLIPAFYRFAGIKNIKTEKNSATIIHSFLSHLIIILKYFLIKKEPVNE